MFDFHHGASDSFNEWKNTRIQYMPHIKIHDIFKRHRFFLAYIHSEKTGFTLRFLDIIVVNYILRNKLYGIFRACYYQNRFYIRGRTYDT